MNEQNSFFQVHHRTHPWRWPVRILKWVFALLLCFLVGALLLAMGLVGYYQSIVRQKPGRLEVPFQPNEVLSWVDPFIGTGGVPWMCAYNSPAATLPFGMVRLGPDTASMILDIEGLNSSGYFYGDNKILGFSHTRLLGADAFEGGNFRILPVAGELSEAERSEGPSTPFSHKEETAFPGYYAVRLPEENVLAELTATPRVGVHRYTFEGEEDPVLLLDVCSALGDARTREGRVRIDAGSLEIVGSVKNFGSFSGRYGGIEIFFVARFDRPWAKSGISRGEGFQWDLSEAEGDEIGVQVQFEKSTPSPPVEVRVGISYVSLQNARLNLGAETDGKKFADIVGEAQTAWEERLKRIEVTGGSERERRIFYTALYRAFQMPTVFNDVNGEYLGFDKEIHVAEGFKYYTDFSLWDTFRTVHPLFNLIAREDQRDMIVSLIEMAKAGGCLPRWPSGGGYTNCMIGTPADMTIPESYFKGIRDFEVETAYSKMRETAMREKVEGSKFAGRGGLEEYLEHGYCPSETMSKALGKTFEYSYADHCLGLFAKELGHTEDAAGFAERAQSYRNLWNPETQYFHPRSSTGEYQEIDPLQLSYTDSEGRLTDDLVEGSALQWRFAIPFDAEGLIGLFESEEGFVAQLESYFEGSTDNVGNWNPGPYYWHGNEPYIHSAYLFNAAGRPDLTQKWVRWIMETKYSDDYVGLDGNDDGGTLSAWYVFSALGFYPVAGTTRYEIGSPIFSNAMIRMGTNDLEILATNQSAEATYVEGVTLNARPLKSWSFRHEEIAEGGTMAFQMAPPPPRAENASTP